MFVHVIRAASSVDKQLNQEDAGAGPAGQSVSVPQPRSMRAFAGGVGRSIARGSTPQSAALLGRMATFALGLSFLASIPVASAQVAINGTAVPCEFCTDSQMREAVAWRGPGTHYVSDLPGSVLRRYTVACGTGGQPQVVGDPTDVATAASDDAPPQSGVSLGRDDAIQSACTGPATVSPATVEAAAMDQFYVVRQIWLDTAGTFIKALDFPYVNTGLFWTPPAGPLGGPNAYNVTSDGNFRTMLGIALANNSPGGFDYVQSLGTYVGAMINAFGGQTDGLRIVIRVVFPDGSSATYVYLYGDTAAQYQQGSATTPTGQWIPDPQDANSANGTGSWSEFGPYGGQEDLERFLEYMRSRGARIVRGDDDRIRRVTCSWDGNTITCTTT